MVDRQYTHYNKVTGALYLITNEQVLGFHKQDSDYKSFAVCGAAEVERWLNLNLKYLKTHTKGEYKLFLCGEIDYE